MGGAAGRVDGCCEFAGRAARWCGLTVSEADRDEVSVGRDERGAVRDALDEDHPHALPLDLTSHLHTGHRGTCDRVGTCDRYA